MTCELRKLAQALIDALSSEAKAKASLENAASNFTGPVDSYEDAYYGAVVHTATVEGNLRRYLKENPTCQACCPPSA